MKKLLLLVLILTMALIICSCQEQTIDSANEQEQEKTVFEIAVEAGFKGTLEDWERAVANEELDGEEAVECRCSGCQNRITLGDAIIIAQTHYFAVYYKDDNFGWADIAKLASEDVENWYIEISPEDVFNDGVEYIYKGQCYIYTINKESGKIIEINSSGE